MTYISPDDRQLITEETATIIAYIRQLFTDRDWFIGELEIESTFSKWVGRYADSIGEVRIGWEPSYCADENVDDVRDYLTQQGFIIEAQDEDDEWMMLTLDVRPWMIHSDIQPCLFDLVS